jgi:predicted ABC-class ATPase
MKKAIALRLQVELPKALRRIRDAKDWNEILQRHLQQV